MSAEEVGQLRQVHALNQLGIRVQKLRQGRQEENPLPTVPELFQTVEQEAEATAE